MITLIAAGSYNEKTGKLGIGNNGTIPWNILEDLDHFKKTTKNEIVVMGRKTYESLGSKPLPDRINIVLSNTLKKENNPRVDIYSNIHDLDNYIISMEDIMNIYIIGGEELYKYFLRRCNNIILSHIHKSYTCDTFFPEIPENFFKIATSTKYPEFTIIEYKTLNKTIIGVNEIYTSLLNNVLNSGNKRPDRTGTGTISVFGKQIKINIKDCCPLLTTKKIAWKTVIKELLWFLRGETDAKILQQQNVHIWDLNTSREFLDKRGLTDYPEGELGPGYGWQIRRSGANYPDPTGGIDQLQQIEYLLENDPFSRRIMWNLYVPNDLEKMALVPCHFTLQLYVTEKYKNGSSYKTLSGMVTMRSNDLFLGNPFNIFSYYVLIRMLAIRHDMIPDTLILNVGDLHIYNNHIDQIKEQMSRSFRCSPLLNIDNNIKNKKWEDITIDDFDLIGYFPHPSIKAPMAV